MTALTLAMPYLLAGIAIYAFAAYLFRRELLGQIKPVHVRSRRGGGR